MPHKKYGHRSKFIMNFKPITPDLRDTLFPIIEATAEPIADISFGNLYAWGGLYQTSWAIGGKHTLVIRFVRPGVEHPFFLCPFCLDDESWNMAVNQLSDLAKAGNYPLVLMGVTPSCQAKLERLMTGRFDYCHNDGLVDYIYLREKLASLSGKKLQSKRNHINKFLSLYPSYQYKAITPDLLPVVSEYADRWLEQQEEITDSLKQENEVVHRFLDHFTELGLTGGCIEIDQRIVAFTLGSPINKDTYDIHVEKADADVDGAYTIINRDFVRTIPEQYVYINREEDLGLPGLRKAKESYRPILKLAKIRATERQ